VAGRVGGAVGAERVQERVAPACADAYGRVAPQRARAGRAGRRRAAATGRKHQRA